MISQNLISPSKHSIGLTQFQPIASHSAGGRKQDLNVI